MTVTINEKPHILPDGSTLKEALLFAGIAPAGIATAVNDEVVAAADRASHRLREGDRIVIIRAFYGG